MAHRLPAAIATVLAVAGIVAATAPAPASATTLVGILPTAAAPTRIEPAAVDRSSLDLLATYDADVRLSTASRSLRGRVSIRVLNTSGAPIDRVELNTVLAPLGALRLGTVTVDGTAVPATVDDQTIVVPLGGVLPAGAAATLDVPFSARLRRTTGGSDWLLTSAGGIVDLYRWLPWVSRRTRFDRPHHGDPFVTPVSPRVSLTLRTDVPMRVAGTGRRTSASPDGLVQVFEAAQVRDMVLTLAADYRWLDAREGDTTIRVATRPGTDAKALMAAARRALRGLERRLGPYPYPLLTVAQSAGGYGMEGPGVAWIPPGTPRGNLAFLVTHEIAHQWFYGLVGNDQARDPFADEAPADFLARDVLGLRRASRCRAAPLDRSIYRYTRACYYETVYIQGGAVLDAARRRMGDAAFWAALRGYVEEHRFGLGSTRELLAALDDATPLDLARSWRPRFPTIYR